MNSTYRKDEKLKGRKLIDLLFSQGKTVAKYPLRLAYLQTDFGQDGKIKMGVSVSKKHFKKAVDRNYYKRVLRETYRLNKQLLAENLDKPYALMLMYQTRDRLDYHEINAKTVQLFEKFLSQVNGKNPGP